jgi:hypothetical protein
MSNVNAVVRTLELAIGRLQRASPDLAEVAVIQAARADIEKVVAGFKGQSTIYVANSASVLRTVARALEPISNAEVRAACTNVLEAAMMTEDSTDQGFA